MKRRFYFGDENENENEDEDDRDDPFDNSEFFQMAQFPFDSPEVSVLDSSIKICESSFFWKFLSIERKLNKIKMTYEYLQQMIDDELKKEKDA